MDRAPMRIPIVCPECGRESLSEFAAGPLAEALIAGESIRLYVRCHDRVWLASGDERE